jgi:hypothetical protein
MSDPTSFLPVALRAYTAPRRKPRNTTARPWALPRAVLVVDTGSRTTPDQGLTFGCWDVLVDGQSVDRGIFYADDLPAEDLATLRAYVATHRADTPGREPLRLLSFRAFKAQVLWKLAYKGRALVVGFNLPFDFGRLAVGWGIARGDYYGGGFSLVLWDYERNGEWHEDRYRPRLNVRTIDSKRALTGFSKRRDPDRADLIPEGDPAGKPDPSYAFPGHLLDLKTLAFALTNEGYSLERACEVFGVAHAKHEVAEHGQVTPKYVDYARRDVLATAEHLEKLLAEFGRHPLALAPTKAFSPASVGKAYLRAMGIRPVLARQPGFPAEVLGHAMVAYYGGRAEDRIRRVSVPVVYLDFLSMYPTVNTLMGLWGFLTAAEIRVEEATEATRDLLASVTLDGCFDPAFWRDLPVLVLVDPDGDVLPVRARYGGGDAWQIGVNVLASGEPRWYTLADCVAATLLAGKAPRVLRAVRLVASEERQAGLVPVALRGAVAADPVADDFFRRVIEERKRLEGRTDLAEADRDRLDQFLKVLANSTSYGVFAEMNRQDLGSDRRERVTVHGLDDAPFPATVAGPEEPGAFCFPPVAAFIAGAARLMLALLERCVGDLGGAYAMCDTDSMAIVATERGGLVPCPGGPEKLGRKPSIRALSWEQVDGIVARFAALNPYDREAVPGSVLKVEKVNYARCGIGGEDHKPDCTCTKVRQQLWCYAISAKRYGLFNRDDGVIDVRKYSEHGLGHLLDPTDPGSDDPSWMRLVWEGILAEELGLGHEEPDWLDRPALSRLTVSGPELLRPFAALNRGKAYADQVKPFNFLLAAHVRPFGHPDGVDPTRFQLIAPFEKDARKWTKLPWVDRYSGKRYRIDATGDTGGAGVARVQTYRDVLAAFRTHPEAKSVAPNGRPCGRGTVGLLGRRVVRTASLVHLGKEANKLEEVEAGVEHDPEEVYTEYADPRRDPWRALVLPVLRRMPRKELAEAVAMSERRLRDLLKGRARPHPDTEAAMLRAAAQFARDELRRSGSWVPPDDLAACAAFLGSSGAKSS